MASLQTEGLGSRVRDVNDPESHPVKSFDGEEKENPTHGQIEESPVRAWVNKFLWHGGSIPDAWLNATAAQVGQVILTMPTSYAQMGLKLGIFFHLFYVAIGMWTCYMLARLYIEYRYRETKKGNEFKNHIIQYHEMIGSLVGRWAKYVVLFFNITTMGSLGAVQIVACASNAYYLSQDLDKRQWALVFGGVSMLTVLLPSFHNFRVFSFIGVLTTTYTAWYMLAAAVHHGQAHGVKHTGPKNLKLFFTGTTNILFASGGHAITIEIMYAMWRPRTYKYVYVATCLYILTITLPHCIALDWAFGDLLLTHSNALGILPHSNARTTALIFMIMHQAVAFGLFVMPLYLMFEKLWGKHNSWFPVRALIRLPVAGFLWFLALLIPFFGPLNSLVGAVFVSFSTFIIPSFAYLYVFWTRQDRQNAAEKMPKFLPTWKGLVALNVFVILTILSLGFGLGGYASIANIKDQIHSFGVFDKCFQCK